VLTSVSVCALQQRCYRLASFRGRQPGRRRRAHEGALRKAPPLTGSSCDTEDADKLAWPAGSYGARCGERAGARRAEAV